MLPILVLCALIALLLHHDRFAYRAQCQRLEGEIALLTGLVRELGPTSDDPPAGETPAHEKTTY
ncbi:MAG: hypothetical protein ACRD3Y_02275 [Bryobacteraceae bacterium]